MIAGQSVSYIRTLTCRSQISVNTTARHVNLKLSYAEMWEQSHAFISYCIIRLTRWLFVTVKDVIMNESLAVSFYPSECGEETFTRVQQYKYRQTEYVKFSFHKQ
jgi:predicted RNA-binding Zn-ribbon protein involved in translation (DUF1610 family)